MKLTDAQVKALTILRDHPGIYPAGFAGLMWGHLDSFHRPYKCGQKGVHKGLVLYQTAGSWLTKLAKKGLVYYVSVQWGREWYISSVGRKALEAHHDRNR